MGVGYAYGERQALAGIDFEVDEGERFGLVGPNGSGKSTLFGLLATLRRPQEGRLEVLGLDVAREPGALRRQLGVVFQSPSLDPELTASENLRCHGRLHGLSGRDLERRASSALARLDVAARSDDRVKTLSGGLRRRVEIAKCLLTAPRLLVLDEPSTGLDPAARRALADALERLCAEGGVTVLLTTHFIEEADRCDRLLLLDRGRVVATGTPGELKRDLGGEVVILTADEPEALASELAHRFGLEPVVDGEEVRVIRPAAHALIAPVAEAFAGRYRSLTVAEPTLEHVFLARTGRGFDTAEERPR
jgi:ABC-2 type transport system ATP-binding protein